MVLEQHSTSELVYTSEEKQILEARKKACEWGADAIVMTGGAVDKGSSFWTGYQDQRSNRVVAIRFLEAGGQTEDSAQ
jgi:hydroxymethylpyrimidine/phosphomethylpyrimidine kinase